MSLRVAVLGLGEAGSEIARDLVAAGADVRGYDPKAIRVDGVDPRGSEAEAVADADLVLSVNSSHDAMAALENALPAVRAGTLWADLNTASPGLKKALADRAAERGVLVVDVGVMSPVPGKGLRTPMLVSGEAADRYVDLLAGLGADAAVQPGPVGTAISRKLLRSVFYKGLAAAGVEALRPGRLQTFDELTPRPARPADPGASAEWWYKNGLNSLWLGNYDGALDSFENSVNNNPNRAEAWIQVGYCLVKQGKNGDAIRAYKQALRLRPDAFETYNKLGDAYYYAGNFDEAIAAYKQAARLRPDQPEAYYNLGMTYLETGNKDAALAQARTLSALDAELYKKLMGELRR